MKTITKTMLMSAFIGMSFTVAQAQCTAYFTATQATNALRGPVPWNIQVTDGSRGPAGTSGLTYLWDFGDGTTSTAQSPIHVYSGPGPYVLCLTVSAPATPAFPGCTSTTFCDTIRVDSLGMKYKSAPEITIQIGDGSDGPTSTPTGVDEVVNALEYTVYPNPVVDQTVVTFTSDISGTTDLNLYNMNGQLVWNTNEILTVGTNTYQIDLERLSKGMYMLKMRAGDAFGMELIVKE